MVILAMAASWPRGACGRRNACKAGQGDQFSGGGVEGCGNGVATITSLFIKREKQRLIAALAQAWAKIVIARLGGIIGAHEGLAS
jgi:hypothetical protein